MSEAVIPKRSEIDRRFTWNAESVFATPEDWRRELEAVSAELPGFSRYQGCLNQSAALLLEALQKRDALFERLGKVVMYAVMSFQVDSGDQQAIGMMGQAQALYGRAMAALAFYDPEIIATGEETLQAWMADNPDLALYKHHIDELFRKQEHIRSAEVEELLGMLSEPFSGPGQIYDMLTNNDLDFPPAVDQEGRETAVGQGSVDHLMASPDRQVRKSAWENYRDRYLAFKNTLASSLIASMQQNVYMMRARRFSSTLEMALFENNIPVDVFHNLIETFRKNLPTWHRYWRVRAKALGVDDLQPYDVWAPLTAHKTQLTYEQAVDLICQGLSPMGEDYVSVVRKGCLQDRWVDVYPNQGKTAGAFSYGAYGTHPFIVMNFNGGIFDLSTLAHELGHSMHSYLTWKTQPIVYSDYSLFVAEVASNFHQALVRGHLLQNTDDASFQINLIEEAMSNFHRYFLIMPTLARFELEMHQRVEKGESLTADLMIERMADLFQEAYGEEMKFDRQRMGITWATFGHLYSDYYVYQYATGISAAHALAHRVLEEGKPAVEDYLKFLKSGSSVSPLEALQMAGVDLTRPEPVEEAFRVLAGYVDRLEQLLS